MFKIALKAFEIAPSDKGSFIIYRVGGGDSYPSGRIILDAQFVVGEFFCGLFCSGRKILEVQFVVGEKF